jgi:hypothetical protein
MLATGTAKKTFIVFRHQRKTLDFDELTAKIARLFIFYSGHKVASMTL